MTHLVLYDGACGLCDRFVGFLVRKGAHERLRFAALQGPIGAAILKQAGRTSDALSTVIVVADFETAHRRILERSDAAILAIASAGGLYGAAAAFRIVPRFVRDSAYDFVARRRYRWFGRFDSCPVPSPATRAKFLDFAPRDPES